MMEFPVADMETAWTPDLFGLVYKKESITLREVLDAHRNDKWTRIMATFVPDELIFNIDLSKNAFRKYSAVLALIDLSGLFGLHEKYANGENGGSFALIDALNSYISLMVEEIYSCEGDVLKFSTEGLLAAWKPRKDEDIMKMVHDAILCSQHIQDYVIVMQKVDTETITVSIAISYGEVIFSIIGNDTTKHFLMDGTPIGDLKYARRICLHGELVLSLSAWEHCSPAQYEYVIKDSNNIKIVKVLAPSIKPSILLTPDSQDISKTEIRTALNQTKLLHVTNQSKPYTSEQSSMSSPDLISIKDYEFDQKIFSARMSLDRAAKWQLNIQLKAYMIKPVLRQIERDQCLNLLTENRRLTILTVDVLPHKCTDCELITLADKIFLVLLSVVDKRGGYVSTCNFYDRTVLFIVAFGVSGYCGATGHDRLNIAQNAIISASELSELMKGIPGIKAVCIGISSGIAYCGIVGHSVRRQYCLFGAPLDKSVALAQISYNTVSCDYDTIFYSSMKKNNFRSRGVKVLKKIGKVHVYEYTPKQMNIEKVEGISEIDYSYPILGRFDDIELFKDILDEIGVAGRTYAGILIEGKKRSGKSRLLDAFASIARSRQIKVLQLSSNACYSDEAYAVIHLLLLQLLDAEDAKSMEDRERSLLRKLNDTLPVADFCYLNIIMKVKFPLSDKYCTDTDWKRHTKTLKIFETILSQVIRRVCIFIDDAQHMDFMSWQFLSASLRNDNVSLVMTLPEPESWDDLSPVESEICKDKRLLVRSLWGLASEFLVPFACQFLNVIAIPSSLEKIFKKYSRNSIAWCEAFLISCLQSNGLTTLITKPKDASAYDLVFPDILLVTKVPRDLTPEDITPPLHWTKLPTVTVCLTNEKFLGFVEARNSLSTLRMDIFKRMNPYQQNLLKCASTLGTVFSRNILQNIMPNHTPLHTAKAVAELVRIRLLECAMVQRKDFETGDFTFCINRKRATFSDMHHLVTCDCRPSYIFAGKGLPSYAHCKLLAFRVPLYCKIIYDMLSDDERAEYHSEAAQILQQGAQRCVACGDSKFLRVPFREVFTTTRLSLAKGATMEKRVTLAELSEKSDAKMSSTFSYTNENFKRRDSILQHPHEMSIISHLANGEEAASASYGLHSSAAAVREKLSMDMMRYNSFLKHESMIHEPLEISYETCVKKFRHIDYRNCQCTTIISCLFRDIYYHIQYTGEVVKFIEFLLEYSAGLIRIGQPTSAIKHLDLANKEVEKHVITGIHVTNAEDKISYKGTVLILMGDAYMDLGNYPQAKRFYSEAVALRSRLFRGSKTICYNAFLEKIKQRIAGFPDYSLNLISGQSAIPKLELASYLQRLSTALIMTDGQQKLLKLIMLKSIRLGFECIDGFFEKAEIYLAAVQIFYTFHDTETILQLEKPMWTIIKGKTIWNDPVEMSILVHVLVAMYNMRALRGELDEAIDIGTKVIKMASEMSMSRVILTVLPSLIEIMVWTKRINEAVDLMRELYSLSDEDTDMSAVTWYYALCLEFLLDAGIVLESYDECYTHFKKVSKSKSGVTRDPESLSRLIVCIAIWQLRITSTTSDTLIRHLDLYATNVHCDKFSKIFSCTKILEAFLMILLHRMNLKKSVGLTDRIQNVEKIVEILENASNTGMFIKPFLYLLVSYVDVLRRRQSASQIAVQKSQKWSVLQDNKLMIACVIQNNRTWKELKYNNMAEYWVQHVAIADAIHWQNIHHFDLDSWASILFPLPVPDLYL